MVAELSELLDHIQPCENASSFFCTVTWVMWRVAMLLGQHTKRAYFAEQFDGAGLDCSIVNEQEVQHHVQSLDISKRQSIALLQRCT